MPSLEIIWQQDATAHVFTRHPDDSRAGERRIDAAELVRLADAPPDGARARRQRADDLRDRRARPPRGRRGPGAPLPRARERRLARLLGRDARRDRAEGADPDRRCPARGLRGPLRRRPGCRRPRPLSGPRRPDRARPPPGGPRAADRAVRRPAARPPRSCSWPGSPPPSRGSRPTRATRRCDVGCPAGSTPGSIGGPRRRGGSASTSTSGRGRSPRRLTRSCSSSGCRRRTIPPSACPPRFSGAAVTRCTRSCVRATRAAI